MSSTALPDEFVDRDDVAAWAEPYLRTALANQWLRGASRGVSYTLILLRQLQGLKRLL